MRALITLLFAVVWSAAAASGFGAAMSEIGIASWLWVLTFSMAGGVLSLLQRLPKQGAVPGALLPQVLRDLLGSIVAGVLVFLYTERNKVDPLMAAFLITLGSWGGAATIQGLYKRFLPSKPDDGSA